MTRIWTKVLVAILGLRSLAGVYALTLDIDPLPVIFAMQLFFVLAVLAWKETGWGALLIVLMGFVIFATEVISTSLGLCPACGPASAQLAFAATTLLVPAMAYLSYRDIRSRPGRN